MQVENLSPATRLFLGITPEYRGEPIKRAKGSKWRYKGQNLSYWAKLNGISPQLIRARVDKGWDLEQAINTPRAQ